MLKTGPSIQVQRLPFTVSTTQHRQAPIPHAIRFSRDTSQRIFRLWQYFEIDIIIVSGPQQ